ncbi:hypothetical protein [Acidaminobacterium chupaoyuni]
MGNYYDAGLRKENAFLYGQIENAKNEWKKAYAQGDKAGMEAAHSKAEAIRGTQGYSGGEDGSDYLMTDYGAYRQSMRGAADEAAEAYRRAAELGSQRLRAQRPVLEHGYDDLAKQAYVNYMEEKRLLPETLSRLGLASQGTAETTAARQSGDYMNRQSAIMRDKQRAVKELENRIEQTEQEGFVQGAQAQAQAAMQAAKWYPEGLAAKQKQQNWETENSRKEQQAAYEKQKDQYERRQDQYERRMELMTAIAKLEEAGADTSALRALLKEAAF